MKTIKIITMAILLLFVALPAAANDPKPTFLEPSEEIENLLKDPKFKLFEDQQAMISFVVNQEGEIVVLCVKTEDKRIENYVKSRLNYKKLKTAGLKNGGKYFLSLKVLASA